MTDFRNAMKAVSKGRSMVARQGWHGSGYVVKGQRHPFFMPNGGWDEQRYKPSWEDIFSNDWLIYPTDMEPIREDTK